MAGMTKQTFRAEGSSTSELCAYHDLIAGMADVAYTKCAHGGCSNVASYGLARRKQLCVEHAAECMVSAASEKYARGGCAKRPKCGSPGNKKLELCFKHVVEGMITVERRSAPAAAAPCWRTLACEAPGRPSFAPNVR